jgi:hypothetical protein
MIPETGSRNELKAACITTCITPVKGEVYLWSAAQVYEYWLVVDNQWPPFNTVYVDMHTSFHGGTCYRKSGSIKSIAVEDWAEALKQGDIRYHGIQLPLLVETHD